MSSWIGEVRQHSPLAVAKVLGLTVRRNAIGPCVVPTCAKTVRSTSRRTTRPPISAGPDGWHCWQCGTSGDALTLICYRLYGQRLLRGDERWRDLRRYCASQGLCAYDFYDGTSRPLPAPRRVPAPPPPPPKRPPHAEVEALWESCAPVCVDEEVSAWIRSRALDLDRIVRLDLARALPQGRLPRWARFMGKAWSASGHRLILPAVDHDGVIRSLRARCILPDVPPGSKSASPAGYGVTGLLYACPLATEMFAGVECERPQLVITEGEPDYLTWAGTPQWAAVGLWSGSWQEAFADSTPDGTTVVMAVHNDAAGGKYAADIAGTYRQRRINLLINNGS